MNLSMTFKFIEMHLYSSLDFPHILSSRKSQRCTDLKNMYIFWLKKLVIGISSEKKKILNELGWIKKKDNFQK